MRLFKCVCARLPVSNDRSFLLVLSLLWCAKRYPGLRPASVAQTACVCMPLRRNTHTIGYLRISRLIFSGLCHLIRESNCIDPFLTVPTERRIYKSSSSSCEPRTHCYSFPALYILLLMVEIGHHRAIFQLHLSAMR